MDADPAAPQLPSGTVTFLFTDIEGSTRLWAADPAAMSASLVVHDAILRHEIQSHGGYVFTTAGDSFAAAFDRASDAVVAAQSAQRALSQAIWPGPVLRVRMGLHVGEAEERGGDYFGPVVNTAARVEAAGHGGQVLITEAVRSVAGSSPGDLTDLGVHRLRDVVEPVRLFQVGEGAFRPLRVADSGLSNLPVRPTRLVGRADEVAMIRRLLVADRLVTLTAVGGSGKTRVAIAVGELELAQRTGGVWFVDLTGVSNDAEVISAVASAVGLNLSAGDAIAQTIGFFADKAALIILDNCEHVVDACAEFAERFLASRGLSVLLATSREALGVEGEQTVLLPSLPCDGRESSGVRLFVDRAVAVNPQFQLSDANAGTVATICSRLDGMPLAIELAAARVTVMDPAELLAGLDNRFQLLGGGRRRQRQRTLEATLDWSYDLLAADEQHILRALGVFVDGFDLEAVAVVSGTARPQVLGIVEALVSKSLVDRADRDGEVRFRLLETVKAYAEDRLIDAGESAVIRDRHLDHFHGLAHAGRRRLDGELSIGLRLRSDLSNIVAAFEWAATTARWRHAGELILATSSVFDMDLSWIEGVALLERAIEACAPIDADLTERMKALRLQWLLLTADPRLRASVMELLSSPVPLVRAFASSMAQLVAGAGVVPGAEGLIASAQTSLDALSEDDAGPVSAPVSSYLSHVRASEAVWRGDLHTALECYEHLTATDRYETVIGVRATYSATALLHALMNQPEAAFAILARADQSRIPRFTSEHARAVICIAAGDLDGAAWQVRRHAERAISGRYHGEAADTLYLLTALEVAEGRPEHARELHTGTGPARTPAGNILAIHLARQLGIVDEHRRKASELNSPSGNPWATSRTRNMSTLSTEMTARGWISPAPTT